MRNLGSRLRGATAALRVASFMLPLTQQRYFEIDRPRAVIMTVRVGGALGRAALPFHTNQACLSFDRLALSLARGRVGIPRPSEIFQWPTKC